MQRPHPRREQAQPPASPSLDAAQLERELHRIAACGVEQLRALWHSRFGGTRPPGLPRDLLARAIAWRLQVEHFGGLDPDTRKLLVRVANGQAVPKRHLRAGAVLVREHRGVSHEVTVVRDGFRWRGTTYPSLTAIARQITGTAWNGPRFFGLRDSGAAQVDGAPGKSEAPGRSRKAMP